ncbi:hypothetical protein AB0I00_34885 [Streptomyces sp. NPDC050803]|uniref:hypothetical protein n=1 Tax=unclassified Streptomyces TaxID=2593676 RepID=UPI003420FB85
MTRMMSHHTPSQAEGERDDEPGTTDQPPVEYTTPSQAEGERDDDTSEAEEPDSES